MAGVQPVVQLDEGEEELGAEKKKKKNGVSPLLTDSKKSIFFLSLYCYSVIVWFNSPWMKHLSYSLFGGKNGHGTW